MGGGVELGGGTTAKIPEDRSRRFRLSFRPVPPPDFRGSRGETTVDGVVSNTLPSQLLCAFLRAGREGLNPLGPPTQARPISRAGHYTEVPVP